MQEVALPQVVAAIEAAFQAEDHARIEALLYPALNQFPELPQFWFYAGNLLFRQGRAALAQRAFERALEIDDNPILLANLGACLRRLNAHEAGREALTACVERFPDYIPALTNLGAMYVNEGNPRPGIAPLEHALALGGGEGAHWNLGLLYLEAGGYARGFDLYREGVGRERLIRNYGAPEPELLSPEAPRAGKTLITWGEQGIGDELMFGTILEDARAEFAEVIFECHPRLEPLHRAAHPRMRIFPTRKDERVSWKHEQGIRADYKCAIGDLAALYRRTPESFDFAWSRAGGAPYRWAIDALGLEVSEYRRRLRAAAGGRPIVGLATRGGVIETSRTYRTLRLEDTERLFLETDALFVALDYDDMGAFYAHVTERHGADRYVWFPSIVQHYEYAHAAALAAACDLVVTVCQSMAHLSAGLGLPTRVLTPSRCAWRYGLEAERWYWYPGEQVRLYRQARSEDQHSWEPAIARVIEDIRALKVRA